MMKGGVALNSLKRKINWWNTDCFNVWNYKHCSEDFRDVIIEAFAVLFGNYSNIQKQAAMILLKIFVNRKFLKYVLENADVCPYSRDDFRVRIWKKKVLSKGKCEMCGSAEDLEAHHIIKWADYPQGRIDVNNGMCLCHKCHTEEHKDDPSYHMMKSKSK